MKKILCYGDSNTYGYDPRGYLGMRYPDEVRWTTILQKLLADQYTIIEEGMNGRPMPHLPREESFLNSMISGLTKDDLLIMMLGTNDILLTAYPDARLPVSRMEHFLQWYRQGNFPFHLLILGPAYILSADEELFIYHKESRRMNAGFETLCKTYSVPYFDAGSWDIPLAYDGVHFSEEGHRVFAEKLERIIIGNPG